jgi:hypothetical protein
MNDIDRFSRWLEDRHADLAIRLRATDAVPTTSLDGPSADYDKHSGALELLEAFERSEL